MRVKVLTKIEVQSCVYGWSLCPAQNLQDLDSGEGGEMLDTAKSLLDFLGFFG